MICVEVVYTGLVSGKRREGDIWELESRDVWDKEWRKDRGNKERMRPWTGATYLVKAKSPL